MSNQPKLYQAGTLTYTRPKLAMLFFWLLWGDFCFILMESIVPTILPLKFKALGASNTTVGLIMITIPMILNSVLNPMISFKSDRYRSRWGRRIPFILFTLPFLVLFLVGIGFGDRIGFWLYPAIQKLTTRFTPNQVAVGVIGVMMIVFSFFNTFVNAVFWYLFNDVIPEHLLARFMSWFRLVSTLAGSFYGFFVFRHAETHAVEIFIGGAVIYVLGFGMMCLFVREGQYPPPPEYVDGRSGPLAAIKTYGTECFSLRHYWYMFLVGISMGATMALGPFGIYYSQAIGLDLEMIGNLSGTLSLFGGISILVSGWLADRYHPIRVTLVGFVLNTFILVPIGLIWLFWHPDPKTVFYFTMITSICLGAPIGSLMGILDPPLFMRIFPRERYGQFCSANALCRSLSLMVTGVLAGVYFDVLTRYFGAATAYRLMPVWQFFFLCFGTFFLYKLYKSWKEHGGDAAYVPPGMETPIKETEDKSLAASA